jgi:LAGLIDADG DNA endonuclease family
VGSREATRLTQRCSEIVVGTILGDGCLERNGRNVRLRIDHGAGQRHFVQWKFKELSELHPLNPTVVARVDVRTGRLHVNHRFATRSVAALNEYFSMFYGSAGVKRIPESMLDVLRSPLSLAVWYMDDGGKRNDCRSGYLNTNAYSLRDVESLKECLRRNFGIATRTHFAAGKPRIYVPVNQFGEFCELIRAHIIPEMSYKLL